MKIKIEDFYKEGIGSPKCVRCGGVLKPNPEIDFDEEMDIYEFICPECGAIHTLSIPEDDDRMNYPYWNGDKSADSGQGYGYDAICPFCVDKNGEHSHWMVWESDVKRSEMFGLPKGTPSKDGYYPDDDDYESRVTSLICPHCGAMLTVGDCISKDYDKYPFWRKLKQETAETAEASETAAEASEAEENNNV